LKKYFNIALPLTLKVFHSMSFIQGFSQNPLRICRLPWPELLAASLNKR